jgi:DEAD/DEAH box helicase domain-containing protein
MCDRSDIGVWVAREEKRRSEGAREQASEGAHVLAVSSPQSPVPSPQSPCIYIFERITAGLGFSQQLFENHNQLLISAEALIQACGCRYGCPACVGPVPLSGESDHPLLDTKQLTLALLHILREDSTDQPTSAKAGEEAEEEIIF